MIKTTPCFVTALVLFGYTEVASAATELHPIVTASRIAQTADQALTAVTVITRDDIEHSQSQSVAEVLRDRVPGLDFLTTGGTGHQVSAFLRGTNSDHVLFMIDGNIIGSATSGSAQLELIPLEQVDRIEIIRGPRSSLYGSQAIGGVIQVFTRDATQTSSASLTLGSHRTQAATAGTGFAGDTTRFDIHASYYDTEGFNVANGTEPDDDGYTNKSMHMKFRHDVSSSTNIHAAFLHADANTEFDNNSFNNHSDSVQQNASIGFDTAINQTWNMSLDVGRSRDRLDSDGFSEDFDMLTFMPLGTYSFSNTLFETLREQLRWQHELAFSDSGQLVLGLDHLNDKVESTTAYSETERDNKALYALLQDKYGRHQLQLSGRVDDNGAFGTHRTGNVAWGYDISGDTLVNLSHGTAFVAPSFNDLYFVSNDPVFGFNGNPDLQPETSRSTELAFSGHHGWGDWALRAYHTEIENLIVLNASFTSVENAEQAEIDGIELELGGKLAGWDSSMSLAVIDPVNTSTGKVLQGRAEHTLKLNLSNNYAGYRVGINLLAQSERFANSANTIELAGYGVIDLVVEKPLNKHWDLQTRIDNILDKDYTTSIDVYGNTTNNTPLSLFVTLAYNH